MRKWTLLLACVAVAFLLGADDGFKREGDRSAKDGLEGKAPPALKVKGWVNTEGKVLELADLKGKVVVIDFWGTWCGPCKAAMPHLKELLEKHKEQGMAVVGIHTTNKGETMADYAKAESLNWPIAVDVDGQTVKAFAVDSYPDYYVIDRAGNLRFADLANGELDRAVEMLLAEKP